MQKRKARDTNVPYYMPSKKKGEGEESQKGGLGIDVPAFAPPMLGVSRHTVTVAGETVFSRFSRQRRGILLFWTLRVSGSLEY